MKTARIVAMALLCVGAGVVVPQAIALAAPAPQLAAGTARTFTVNSTTDRGDAHRDGVCATAAPVTCTLRAAIQEADAANGPVTIAFAIAGGGVHTIAPASQLPALTNAHYGITIDGFTQPGSAPNTNTLADNAVRTIEVVGKGPSGFEGFDIDSAHNTIRGLDVHAFRRAFVMRDPSSAFTSIVGDLIGLTATGNYDPNFHYVAGSSCIEIAGGAHDNVVGAPGNANRNTIGGCSHHGVAFYNSPTTRNEVQNNIFGLDPTGTQHRGDEGYAIDINTATTYTIIGGVGTEQRNVISGMGGNGVEISHEPGTQHNEIIGNFIGTNLSGTAVSGITANNAAGVHLEGKGNCGNSPCPPDENHNLVYGNVIANNRGPGVLIDKGAHDDLVADNWIGVLPNGVAAPNEVGVFIEAGAFSNSIGPGNQIAYNANAIELQPTLLSPPVHTPQPTNFNTFTQNSIYSAKNSLAIDLTPFGTPNTNTASADANEGVRTATITQADRTTITVHTCAGCHAQLFLSSRGAGLGGSGVMYLASAIAGSNGVATFKSPSATFGHTVTVTATTPRGSTSEFSIGAWVK